MGVSENRKPSKLDSFLNLSHIREMSLDLLPKALRKEPFSLKEANQAGLTKYAIAKLIQAGALERLQRGIYQISERAYMDREDAYRSATLRCGLPSAICLLSALEYYHLTDQIPTKTWVMVPNTKRVQSSSFRLVRSRNPQWELGIQKCDGYWITTPERSLVDCLLAKRSVGSAVALEALKQATASKKIRLTDVVDIAKKMGVFHQILPYIEVFAL